MQKCSLSKYDEAKQAALDAGLENGSQAFYEDYVEHYYKCRLKANKWDLAD